MQTQLFPRIRLQDALVNADNSTTGAKRASTRSDRSTIDTRSVPVSSVVVKRTLERIVWTSAERALGRRGTGACLLRALDEVVAGAVGREVDVGEAVLRIEAFEAAVELGFGGGGDNVRGIIGRQVGEGVAQVLRSAEGGERDGRGGDESGGGRGHLRRLGNDDICGLGHVGGLLNRW